MAAYADDVTAAKRIIQLKNWWKTLCTLSPKFGYYPEASKSWLILKEKAKQRAFTVFKDIEIKITTEGQRHLVVIRSSKYKREYVQKNIGELINKSFINKGFFDNGKDRTSCILCLLILVLVLKLHDRAS